LKTQAWEVRSPVQAELRNSEYLTLHAEKVGGGLRVVYLDLPDREVTYLLYLYGKNEAKDLTSDEKKALKNLVSSIKGERQ